MSSQPQANASAPLQHDGCAVTVSVQIAAGRAELSAGDQGIGIAEDQLPRVFERHYRTSKAPGVSGAGLGVFCPKSPKSRCSSVGSKIPPTKRPTHQEMPMEQHTLELLFRWLHSGKEESDRAFCAYHQAMSGPLRRTLALRHLRGAPSLREDPDELAEDLLQEVFIEWFRWIKQERPDAHRRIGELAPAITLPAHGVLFDRRCKAWAGAMQAWADAAMSFGQTLPPNAEVEATALNGRLKPLKAEAEKLPKDWYGKVSAPGQEEAAESADLDDDGDGLGTASAMRLRALAKWACEKIRHPGSEAADAELGTAGAAAFAVAVEEIHRVSAKVLVPLPALLYWLAGKRAVDHFRKRKALDNGTPLELNGEDEESGEPAPIDTVADPRGEKEIQDLEFEQAVRTLLFAELRQARQDCAPAKKLEKLERLCATRWMVFNLWMAGHTQAEIAAKTDLTRDQVRTCLNHIIDCLKPLKNT